MKTTTTTTVSLRTRNQSGKNRKSGLRRGILATSAVALIGLCLAPQDARGAADNYLGGAGALWDTTTNWSLAAKPTAADSANFTLAAPVGGLTITLTAGEVANNLTFSATGYVLTGGNLTLNAGAGAVDVSPGLTATISSVLTGAGSTLNKTGTGTLIVTSAGNTYTGATNVNAGTLQLDGTLTGSIVTVNSGGTLSGSGTITNGANLNGTGIINFGATGNIVGSMSVNGGNWNGLGSVGPVNVNTANLSIGAGANMTTTGVGLAVNNAATFSAAAATSTVTGNVSYFSTAASNFQGVLAGVASTLNVNNAASSLTLSGTSANTFGGVATVNAGTLILAKSLGTDAISGSALIIGNAADAAGNATVRLGQTSQIANTTNVTINKSGVFDMNGFGESINNLVITSGSVTNVPTNGVQSLALFGNLNMTGGTISGGTGATPGLLLAGGAGVSDVTATSDAAGIAATINSNVTLAFIVAQTRTFTVNNGLGAIQLNITGVVQDGVAPSNITKAGTGVMQLTGLNTYTGVTTVNVGKLIVSQSTVGSNSALGFGNNTAANGTVVNGGGTLQLANGISITNEFLTLNNGGQMVVAPGGTATWGGSILVTGVAAQTIDANGGTLTLNGNINKSDSNLTFTDSQNSAPGVATINVNGSITGNAIGYNDDLLVTGVTTNLNAANTYLGPTHLSSTNVGGGNGILNANVANALPTQNGRTAVDMDQSGTGGSILNIGGSAGFPAGANQAVASLVGATTSKVTLGNNTLTVGFGSGVNTNGTANAVFAGVISGTGAVTKDDTSRQILTGTNSYTGFTTINGGVLQIGNGVAANSQVGPSLVFLNAGNLDINLANNGTFNNTVFTLAGTSVRAIGANTNIIGGTINGTGGLDQNGTGLTILTNTNTYTGPTNVNAGTLQVGNGVGGSIAAASAVTVAGGATLAINLVTGGTFGSNVANTGTINAIFNGNGTNTVSGIISGAGVFNQQGTGTTIVTGANTYTGQTTVNFGTLQIGDGVALGTSIATSGTVVVNNASTLAIKLPDQVANGLANGTFGNNVNITGTGTVVGLAVAGATNTLSGVISGANGNLAQSGGGTTILTGANTYGGTTTVNSGTLQVGAGGATGQLGTGNVINNSILTFNRNNTLTVNNAISGTGVVNQSGTAASITVLGGNNTYSGQTNVNSGTLRLGSANALGTAAGGTVVANGATLDLFGQAVGNEALTVQGTGVGALGAVTNTAGGVASLSGPVTLANDTTFGGTANITLSGIVTGNAALTQIGTNALILTGNNNYTGLTTVAINSTLVAGSNNALGQTGSGTLVQTGGSLYLANGVTTAAEPLTINGNGVGGTGALSLQNFGDVATYGGPITLGSASRISSIGGVLTLAGTINKTDLTLTFDGTFGAGIINANGAITGNATGFNDDLNVNGTTVNLNAANTYLGPTFITSIAAGDGILNANVANALPTLNGRTSITMDGSGAGGSQLNIVSSQSIASLVGTGTSLVSISNGQVLTIGFGSGLNTNGTANANFAGVISGAGGLTKDDTSTQILSGANTFLGNVNVNGGILSLQNGAAIANSVAVTVTTPGILNLINSETIGSLAGTGNVTLNANLLTTGGNNTSTTFSGVMSGNGAASLIKTGTGTFTLSGANTFTGTAVVNNGVLQLQNGAAIADTVAVTVTSPGSLDLLNSETIGSLVGSGNTTLNANTLTTGGNNTSTTYSGVMSGNGAASLIKTGTGTFTLTGANTFTGTAVVNNGVLQLQNGAAIADTVAVTVTAPGSLDLLNSETIGSLAGNGNTTLNANLLTTGGNNGTTTFSGVMSGNGAASLIKTGTGTMTLSGANTFTGTAVVNNGILSLQNGAAIADSVAVTVTTPGTLNLLNSETIGSLAGTGNVTLNANLLTTGGNNTSTTFSGVMSGNGVNSLIKTGTGTMTFSGANTFTGTAVVNNGILSLSGGSALADVVAVTVTTPGALNLVNSETIGSLAGSGNTTLNANTLTTGGNNGTTAYSGIMSGTGGLTKTGTGTFTISGANTFSGPTNVNAGILSLAGGAALADTSAVIVTSPGTLNLVNSETIASLAGTGAVTLNAQTLTTGVDNTSTTFSGAISGAGGALVKQGTGFFTVSGANTYTGGTTLNAGTLGAGSGTAFGNGNLTVNSGTLRTVGGPLVVNIGGGNIQLNGGTTVFNVGGTTPGVTHDQLLTTGSVGTITGTLTLVQQNGYLLQPGDKVNLITAGFVTGGSKGGTPLPAGQVIGLAAFSNTPLLVPTVNLYSDPTVTLEAMQGSFLGLGGVNNAQGQFIGYTPNQRAVAAALDSVARTINLKTGIFKELNFLDTQPLGTLPSNLDKIAPEELTAIFTSSFALANVQTANLQRRMEDIRNQATVPSMPSSARSGNNTVYADGAHGPVGRRSKEIAPPSNDRWGMFLTGSGEFSRVGSTTNAAGYHLETGGVTAGIDYRVNTNLAVGLDLGYVGTTASLINGGKLDNDGGRLGLYATWFQENFHIDAAVNGGLNSYKTRRTTPNNTVATGSPDGSEINILIAAGYDWKFGGLTVGPTASYQYTNVRMDGFTETGAFAPLSVNGQTAESSRTALGIRAFYDAHVGRVIVRPEARLSWQHEFGDNGFAITSRFATLGGNPFTVTGAPIGRDSLLIGAGFSILWNDRFSTYVYYDGEVGRSNYDSHNVSGGFRLQF